jgi:hypothetical protein
MSKESSGRIKTQAEALIDAASVITTGDVSLVHRATLTEAITEGVDAAAHQGTGDSERLDKLETQTRVLADAVIAIADTRPSPAVAPAISAVKVEMTGEVTPSVAASPGEYFDRRRKD